MRKKGFKGLSPKLQLRKTYVNIPVDVFQWLEGKSIKEAKSISVVITEILTQAKEQSQQK